MAGRPKADLILSENENHQLEAYTRRRKTPLCQDTCRPD